jgi:hypothetical protein
LLAANVFRIPARHTVLHSWTRPHAVAADYDCLNVQSRTNAAAVDRSL